MWLEAQCVQKDLKIGIKTRHNLRIKRLDESKPCLFKDYEKNGMLIGNETFCFSNLTIG